MHHADGIGLADVQRVYDGPERLLWELVMGQQIHIGGLRSSLDLADQGGIARGATGVDLCCCTGAGMRFLLRFREVRRMTGVDATAAAVETGRSRCAEEGVADRIDFVVADACRTGLPTGGADFVWGEDAWCYVVDKAALIAEAARLVRRGGTIAFTDWIEGDVSLSDAEAERLLRFMKFPSIADRRAYTGWLDANGCDVLRAQDTGRFAAHVELYIQMLEMQLTYDALRIVGFDRAMLEGMAGEMAFLNALARDGKIVQGLFVARRRAA